MDKECPTCGFKGNPNDSHYCGNCGNNIEVKGNEWKLYCPKKSFILPKDFYFGIVAILIGICLFALPIIEWSNPEILSDIPSYSQSTLAKIIWIIVTAVLTMFGLLMCLYGFDQCSISKEKNG